MAVLKFRKFNISKKMMGEGYEDERGDYHEGETTWSEPTPCDLVPNNGKATITKYQDGSVITYSYTVYLPKGSTATFKVGDVVRVTADDETVVETDVKGFMRYQLQSKVWV